MGSPGPAPRSGGDARPGCAWPGVPRAGIPCSPAESGSQLCLKSPLFLVPPPRAPRPLPAEVPLLFRCRRGDNTQFAYCWRQPGSLFIGAAREPGNYRRRLKAAGPRRAHRGRGREGAAGDALATRERRTRVEAGGAGAHAFLGLFFFYCGQRDPGGHQSPADHPFLGKSFDFFNLFCNPGSCLALHRFFERKFCAGRASPEDR